MRTIIATKILALALVAQAFTATGDHPHETREPVAVGQEISVFGGDREQVELVRWASQRFERAGLELPDVAVYFHRDTGGCYGFQGYELDGRVDVCMIHVSELARRIVLHELGHRWIDENVSQSVRDRFLEQRNLRAWSETDVRWDARGSEHGAEIIAWALGTRHETPTIPDRDPARLAAGFELLTGARFPPPSDV